jgi:hypothetical protein
MRSSQR